MKPKEFYAYITKHMTAEEALMKLLESSTIQYEKLKFDDKNQPVHPVFIMAYAAMDMGWEMVIRQGEGNVDGMVTGSEEYIKETLKDWNFKNNN